jgi:hypothetical protein
VLLVLMSVAALSSSPFAAFKPYAWYASGAQVRLSAIQTALRSLAATRRSCPNMLIRSTIVPEGVRVRINRNDKNGELLLLNTYTGLPRVTKPAKSFESDFSVAASALYTTASETLSDADPRWACFTISVEMKPGNTGLRTVVVSSSKGGLDFFLDRLIILSPRIDPVVVPGHGLQ